MGLTLSSAHIFGPPLDSTLPAREFSPGWQTLCGVAKHPDIERLGRRLSKQTGRPVLTFFYFDDEALSLNLYAEGRTAASYVESPEFSPERKKITNFAVLLGFPNSAKTAISQILRCEDLSEKIELLEEFFGVGLMVDPEEFGEPEPVRRDDSHYKAYLARLRASKIQNKTKLVLEMEEPLYLCSADVPVDPLEQGGYYRCSADPGLRRDQRPLVRFEQGRLVAADMPAEEQKPFTLWWKPQEVSLLKDGVCQWRYAAPADKLLAHDFAYEKPNRLWLIQNMPPVPYRSEGLSLSLETGQVLARADFKPGYLNSLVFSGGRLYAMLYTNGECEILEMDENFAVLLRLRVPQDVSGLRGGPMERGGIFYMHSLSDGNILYYFDSHTMQIGCTRLIEPVYYRGYDLQGNVFASSDHSLWLFDRELHPLSRHRVKGYPMEVADGFLLTVDESAFLREDGRSGSIVRIYRIVYF